MKLRLFIIAAAVLLSAVGCKKSAFVSANTDPSIVSSIDPREQFANACFSYSNAIEWYYDNFQNIMPWMQQLTQTGGNTKTFLTPNHFNQRYSVFFPSVGSMLSDIPYLVSKMPPSSQAGYAYMLAMAEIYKIYYAYYVSDIYGDIPYTDAFAARYGGTLTPAYQKQQDLFTLFETTLKADIAMLKSKPAATQVALGAYDQFFGGSTTAWVKAANSLRLRLAFRLLKRDETTAKGIITSVLGSDAGDLMSSNTDSWGLLLNYNTALGTGATVILGGDYTPVGYRAPKPTVDFMWRNSDPRIRNFYQPNNYSQANINRAIAAGINPGRSTANTRQYIGSTTSPDSAVGKYASWYITKKVNNNLSLDTLSTLKYKMWLPSYNAYVDSTGYTGPGGTGQGYFPIISYAEFCFMEAEAIVRGYISGDASAWYNAGITSSINAYDVMAQKAILDDYKAVTNTEITNYLASADVKYNAAKALEQIAIQSYLNFYKQPNEAWAGFKRTGIPNNSTALANENITINGTIMAIPRRAAFNIPATTDLDYATKTAAITDMTSTGEYGASPTDYFGRVWWDKK